MTRERRGSPQPPDPRPGPPPDPLPEPETMAEAGEVLQPSDEAVGLECRRCGCQHFFVIYTRPAPRGRIQRRRECRHCGARITTYETGG